MGTKKKIGKARKDKFYQLAKESGFRARSAFKLIQLNRKFEFLQGSRVVIDLCAAPGGWLQVASENCPVSSVIVGVDLVPIKPIRSVITLVDDIFTAKCRQDLKKELQTWKADCVLHDGAPNVGKNWAHDAFQQSQLTLQALKIATEFLRKGGWFITKVFRSKDYNALMWVFQQFFKDVQATKPQASRTESAEIFVVCQNYLAPDKIDPKFLDPKSVFKDVDDEPSQAVNLLHPEKQTRHRGGYKEGDYTLFHILNASDFIKSDNYLELLADASEIKLDDGKLTNHPSTTDEIKECLKDIKVLGKREIRWIISWRKLLKKELDDEKKLLEEKETDVKEKEIDESEDEANALEEQLANLEDSERKALKHKIKKIRRVKARLQHQMDTKLVLPDDKPDIGNDRELFNLNKIKSKRHLETVEADNHSDLDEEDNENIVLQKKTKVVFDRDSKDYCQELEGASEDEEMDSGDQNDDDGNISLDEADIEEVNPLLFEQPGRKAKTDMWFSKETFAGLDDEDDEDIEIEQMAEAYKKKGGIIKGITNTNYHEDWVIPEEKIGNTKIKNAKINGKIIDENETVDHSADFNNLTDNLNSDSESSDDSENDSGSDSDSDYDTKEFYKQQKQSLKENTIKGKPKLAVNDFEVVPLKEPVKLNEQGLALGSALVSSRKRKREIIESGYHRYMFNDENLPDWFVKDEARHHKIQIPVSKGEIEEYKLKKKAIDANPIKKIAEAKARKKRKMARRLEKARKKADAINDTEEVTDREKWQQIKQVYKKAGLLSKNKKEVSYVVSKKGLAGKKVSRPQGVKGPYKVVDGRMKKDIRAKKRTEQRKKGKGRKRR